MTRLPMLAAIWYWDAKKQQSGVWDSSEKPVTREKEKIIRLKLIAEKRGHLPTV